MRFRLIAVGLVSVLLIWWGQSETESRARRAAKQAERASSGQRTPESPTEQPEPETASPSEEPPADTRGGRVRVLGPGGVPLAGIRLGDRDKLLQFAGPTDATGWARWSAEAELPRYLEFMDSLVLHKHVLRRPETIIQLDRLLPLEVEYIDVATGAVIEEGSARLPRFRGDSVHGSTPRELRIAPLRAGKFCVVELELEPPPGRSTELGLRASVSRQISVLAERVRLRIPVWPELELTLLVRDPQGNAVPGVRLGLMGVTHKGNMLETTSVASDAAGRIAVRGAPYLGPSEFRIALSGMHKSQKIQITGRRIEAELVFERVDDDLDLDTSGYEIDFEEEWDDDSGSGAIGIGGGGAAAIIDVKLVEPDGSLAGGVPVFTPWRGRQRPSWSAKKTGEAVLDGLPAGRLLVVVNDLAFAYAERRVEVVEGERVGIQIGPSVGRTMTFETRSAPGTQIVVRTEYGAITPFANGLQDLTAVTGPDGTLVWPRFPKRAAGVMATRGARSVRQKIAAGDVDEVVTLTLR